MTLSSRSCRTILAFDRKEKRGTSQERVQVQAELQSEGSHRQAGRTSLAFVVDVGLVEGLVDDRLRRTALGPVHNRDPAGLLDGYRLLALGLCSALRGRDGLRLCRLSRPTVGRLNLLDSH